MNQRPESRRQIVWWRWSIRTLLIVIVGLSIVLCSWANRCRSQADAVRSLENVYARVMFDFQESSAGVFDPNVDAPLPKYILRVTGVHPFHSVVWVDCDSPAVTDESLKHLESLPNLQVLHISNTSVTDEGLAVLRKLTRLRFLTISSPTLSDVGLDHIGHLHTLRKLMIFSSDEVTDNGLVRLHGLKNLREVDLDDTKITAAGVRRLREALPHCEIDYW